MDYGTAYLKRDSVSEEGGGKCLEQQTCVLEGVVWLHVFPKVQGTKDLCAKGLVLNLALLHGGVGHNGRF